ncbi:MAG: aminotransferase class I/II-fold pyridoxal phosphate-dependent enzyme [Candidatus Micrarchaeaceae archaeon]
MHEMGFLSIRSRHVYNALLEDEAIASAIEARGKKVIYLNAGDPTAFFPTPMHIIKEYKAALNAGKTAYAAPEGAKELREAIAMRYNNEYGISANYDDVLVTQGVSEALDFLNESVINPGDSGVLFKPYYPLYPIFLLNSEGKPIYEHYYENKDWNIDPDMLDKTIRKSGKKPKYVLITNPNNPTGTILKRGVLEDIAKLANEYSMLLVSDEIYDEIIFNNKKFTSVAQIAKGMPYVILNGMSKAYDATGFRLGYMLIPEQDNRSVELKGKLADYARARLSANTPAQYAFAASLKQEHKHKEELRKMVSAIEERAKFITKRINESEYMHAVEPSAAFYVFPKLNMELLNLKDDKEFVNKLLIEKQVMLSRGSGFGEPGYVRIIALPQKDILSRALDKIEEFCKEHRK